MLYVDHEFLIVSCFWLIVSLNMTCLWFIWFVSLIIHLPADGWNSSFVSSPCTYILVEMKKNILGRQFSSLAVVYTTIVMACIQWFVNVDDRLMGWDYDACWVATYWWFGEMIILIDHTMSDRLMFDVIFVYTDDSWIMKMNKNAPPSLFRHSAGRLRLERDAWSIVNQMTKASNT